MSEVFQYYGADWLAMLFTFLAIWQIGNHKRRGFVIMIAGNIGWVAFGILTDSIAMIIANILFVGLNIRAIRRWTKDKSE